MKRIIGVAVALFVGGCHDSTQAAQERQAEICAIGCDCLEPGKTTCAGECATQGSFSTECGDCILQNSSSCALVNACLPKCEGGGGSGSGSAGIVQACGVVCACQTGTTSGSAFDACNSSCETNASPACVACINADATCNAQANCQSQCGAL